MTTDSRERKTVPPEARVVDPEEEQRALALALAKHEDPTVRLIASMAQRQLDLAASIGALSSSQARQFVELKDDLQSLRKVVENLMRNHKDLESRVTELRKNNNSSGGSLAGTG